MVPSGPFSFAVSRNAGVGARRGRGQNLASVFIGQVQCPLHLGGCTAPQTHTRVRSLALERAPFVAGMPDGIQRRSSARLAIRLVGPTEVTPLRSRVSGECVQRRTSPRDASAHPAVNEGSQDSSVEVGACLDPHSWRAGSDSGNVGPRDVRMGCTRTPILRGRGSTGAPHTRKREIGNVSIETSG
jgi:hypothetical protein